MRILTKRQILLLHSSLIAEFGGMDGVRDEGLLESAINSPFQSFAGIDVYPTTEAKAAHLAFGLIKNHAFVDGNKRIGAHVMLVFLALNNIELDYTQDELISIILAIASSTSSDSDLVSWICLHKIN